MLVHIDMICQFSVPPQPKVAEMDWDLMTRGHWSPVNQDSLDLAMVFQWLVQFYSASIAQLLWSSAVVANLL